MPLQRSDIEVPGTGARMRLTSWRVESIGIQLVASRRFITDWGLQTPLVRYITQQTRTQLSVVLAGTGYAELGPGRFVTLRAGDALRQAQSAGGAEGYGGDPLTVLIVEWRGDALGAAHRGPASIASLDRATARALRASVDAMDRVDPKDERGAYDAARRVLASLAAAGVIDGGPALGALPPFEPDRSPAARVYAAIGEVRAGLHRHPSLPELAERASLSERHARRAFDAMDATLGTTSSGWRETIGDLRIGMAQQLLSLPELPLSVVAERAGFRSPVALCHAFAERGGITPRALARALAERWDVRLDRRAWGEAAE